MTLNQSKDHHHLFQYIQICTVEAFYQFPLIQLPHSHQNYHPYQQNHKEHSFEYGQLLMLLPFQSLILLFYLLLSYVQ